MNLSYRSYSDLSQVISSNIQKIPHCDIVVGVPKSGLIPAIMIATMKNLSFFDLDGFIYSFSARKGQRRQQDDTLPSYRKVLIVDDSINTGTELRRIASELERFSGVFDFIFCAIFGPSTPVPKAPKHIVLDHVDQPRIFQWNYRNHIVAEHASFDMDGVLCEDPQPEWNDDGVRYRRFLKEAKPLYIPKKRISAIVTSRLERYRSETKDWLEQNEVDYNELIMLDLPDAETRRRLKAHAPFKASAYSSRSDILFVESNQNQAVEIAKLTNKPVISVDTDTFYYGAAGATLTNDARRRLEVLENDNHMLRSHLRSAASCLRETSIDYTKWIDSFDVNNYNAKFTKRPPTPFRDLALVESKNKVITRVQNPVESKKSGYRIAMISTSFNIEVGAGAAASSMRLRDTLRDFGNIVETFSLDSHRFNGTEAAGQPVKGSKFPLWINLGTTSASEKIITEIHNFSPDCIILGALDRSVLGVTDLFSLKFPIVWITRDNLNHTGGCLFKLDRKKISYTPDSIRDYTKLLTCDQYLSGCQSCPAVVDERDQSVVSASFRLKSLVYRYRPDIVFCAISDWLKNFMKMAPLTSQHEILSLNNPIPIEKSPSRSVLRSEFGIEADKNVILFPIHTSENTRKGFSLGLEALGEFYEMLDDEDRQNITIAVFGNVSKVEKKDLLFETISLGFIKDSVTKSRLYKAADVCIVPTLQESLSVVASECVRHGTPVVSFSTSGLEHFVKHRANGYTADCFDTKDLARGLYWSLYQSKRLSVRSSASRIGRELFDPASSISLINEAIKIAIVKFAKLDFDENLFDDLHEIMSSIGEFDRFRHIHRRSLEKQLKLLKKGSR